MEEDKILYEKFLRGDEEAFNLIVKKYNKNLLYFITRYVKNMEIAEDIFQDVVLYMLENKEKYDSKYSLKTYMYMIAKSRSINYINQNQKISEMPEDLADENLLEEIICSKERKEKIQTVINKLQLDYQLVIYLTQIEGLSYKETAEIMEKTESQIKTLAHNSKKKLKKMLVKEKVIEIRNNKIIALISIFLFISAMVTGITYADEIKEFIKEFFGANASDGVDTAVNNGFVTKGNSEPQDSEGIEASVEEFMMDDYNFGINFLITLDEKHNSKDFKQIDLVDLNIIDENDNTVFNTHISKFETEELKDKKYMGGYSFSTDVIDNKNFMVSLSATNGMDAFPKSKKLIINFTEMKITKTNGEEIVYKGNWNLEADVPEGMYNRENVIYKVKSCNDENTIVADASLSNTTFKISIPVTTTDKIDYKALYDRENMKSIYSLIALQKEYVETSDGKRFETAKSSDADGGYGSSSTENKITDYHQTFNLTKYDATDILTVHIFTNTGEEIVIEYEKVK